LLVIRRLEVLLRLGVTGLGQVKVISTELEELRADNMKLRQVIRGLEKVYQSPPVSRKRRGTKEKVLKYSGCGLGIAAVVILLLIILGVIRLG